MQLTLETVNAKGSEIVTGDFNGRVGRADKMTEIVNSINI